MTDFNKVTSIWGNFLGAPGYSTMYFASSATPPLAAVKAFWEACKNILPLGITVTVQNTGVGIDLATGKPDSAWSGPVQTPTTGTGTAPYAAPVGGMVEWKTGQFINGHELKGRTYIVPLTAPVYDTAGSIVDANVAAVTAAATTLLAASPSMVVWSRRSFARANATTAVMRDRAVVMRTRRVRA